jgi:phage shock protein C
MEKKLVRDEQHKMIAGVCAGLAEYLSMDVTVVRVLFMVTLIFHGAGLLPYIVLWIVLPKKVYTFNNTATDIHVDYTVPPVSNPFDVPQPQQSGTPFTMPPKKASNASIIVGIALVAFGAFFLLDNFDLLPDWQFDRLWPVIIIIIGVVMVFSRRKQNPWDKQNWHTPQEPATTEVKEEPTNDNPPTV